MLAFRIALERWMASENEDFARHAAAALNEVQECAARLDSLPQSPP